MATEHAVLHTERARRCRSCGAAAVGGGVAANERCGVHVLDRTWSESCMQAAPTRRNECTAQRSQPLTEQAPASRADKLAQRAREAESQLALFIVVDHWKADARATCAAGRSRLDTVRDSIPHSMGEYRSPSGWRGLAVASRTALPMFFPEQCACATYSPHTTSSLVSRTACFTDCGVCERRRRCCAFTRGSKQTPLL